MQWIVKTIVAGCVLGLTACSSGSVVDASPSAVESSVAAASCESANFTSSWGEPDGAAGTTYDSVTFTNDGDTTCVASEAPKVTLTSGGADLLSLVTRGEGDLALPFMLEPGQSLVLTIGITSPDNFDDADCKRKPADGLTVVYSPGTTVHLDKALGDVCTVAAAAPFIESWETLVQ